MLRRWSEIYDRLAELLPNDPSCRPVASHRNSQRSALARVNDLADPPAQCHAMSKTAGRRCRRSPVQGRRTCRFHGGNRPTVLSDREFLEREVAKAERRLARARAARVRRAVVHRHRLNPPPDAVEARLIASAKEDLRAG